MSSAPRRDTAILKRFAGRQELGREELRRVFSSADAACADALTQLFDFIEDEFGIPVGLLRPADELVLLFAPAPAHSFWGRLKARMTSSDKRLELRSRLEGQLRRHGTQEKWSDVETIGALVTAWCGGVPEQPT